MGHWRRFLRAHQHQRNSRQYHHPNAAIYQTASPSRRLPPGATYMFFPDTTKRVRPIIALFKQGVEFVSMLQRVLSSARISARSSHLRFGSPPAEMPPPTDHVHLVPPTPPARTASEPPWNKNNRMALSAPYRFIRATPDNNTPPGLPSTSRLVASFGSLHASKVTFGPPNVFQPIYTYTLEHQKRVANTANGSPSAMPTSPPAASHSRSPSPTSSVPTARPHQTTLEYLPHPSMQLYFPRLSSTGHRLG